MSDRSHRRSLCSKPLLIASAVTGCVTAAAVLARTVSHFRALTTADITEVAERVPEEAEPSSDPTMTLHLQTSVSRITVSPVFCANYVALDAAEISPGDRLARDGMYVVTNFQFRALDPRTCPGLEGLNLSFARNGNLHFLPKPDELSTAGYEHPITSGEKVYVEMEPGTGRRPGVDQGDRVADFIAERLDYGGARLVLLTRERDDPVLYERGMIPISVATEHFLRLCWRRRHCWMSNSGVVLENVELPRDEDGKLCAPCEIHIGNTVKLHVVASKVGNDVDPGMDSLCVWDSEQRGSVIIRVGDPVVLVFGDNE